MRLIAWNSQGAKWGTFWDSYLTPVLDQQSVVGLLVEAGWAPWIRSGEVPINSLFDTDVGASRYQNPPAGSDDAMMVDGVAESRRRKAFWVPWVAHIDAIKTNSRCSIGGILAPTTLNIQSVRTIDVDWFMRPVLRVMLGTGNNTEITFLLVHCISGWPRGAQQEIDYLTAAMRALIPQGTAGIVVGDMNINLLTTDVDVPVGWRILHTGVATQQSGGELDYALLWDPSGAWPRAQAHVVEQFKTGDNGSDHSVLAYQLD